MHDTAIQPDVMQVMDARCERWGRWRRDQMRYSLDARYSLLGRLMAEKAEAKRRKVQCPNCSAPMKRRLRVGLVCVQCACVATADDDKIYANLIHKQGPKPEPEHPEEEATNRAIYSMPSSYSECVLVLETEYDPRYADLTIAQRAGKAALKEGTYRELNRRALSYLVGYFAANPDRYWRDALNC